MALDIPGGFGQTPLGGKGFDLSAVYSDAAKIDQLRAGTGEANARTRMLQAEVPGAEADAQAKVAQGPALAAQAQLQTAAARDQMIARAAAQIDPDDPDAAEKWDAAYQDLVDKGVTTAKQFIGNYSPKAARRIAEGWGAPSPAAQSLAGATGGMPVGQSPPDSQFAQQFAAMTPEQLAPVAQKLDAVRAGLEKVFSSPDPSAEWDRQAQAMGHPDQVGKYNYLRAQSLYQEIQPEAAYLQSRLAQAGAGAPAPVVGGDVKEAGGALYAVTPSASGPKAKALTPAGDWSLVGTSADGKGVYVNNKTGEEHTGDNPLSAKPGTMTGARGTFAAKQQAWLDVHPGDTQGALDFAGGRKTMAPAQAQEAAASQAARDLAAMAQAGQPPTDPQAFLRQATAEHFAELTAASSAPAGGTAAPGGAPPPADENAGNRISIARSYATAAHAAQAGGSAHAQAMLTRVQADALKLPPMADPGVTPPARAVAQIREGQVKVFNNSTAWTLRNGKPVRLW